MCLFDPTTPCFSITNTTDNIQHDFLEALRLVSRYRSFSIDHPGGALEDAQGMSTGAWFCVAPKAPCAYRLLHLDGLNDRPRRLFDSQDGIRGHSLPERVFISGYTPPYAYGAKFYLTSPHD
ncbi:hypothetical protein PVAR5_6305 [Paecilomyces variotii No. 5]|uniref:Uncharacterized protein n=1 Tax=Byssochlamys spectabilis (strain No. 5 / NBRC 109023) TaxID=1356009 RepID=V5I3E3_BYSSN|nr:hypothetical protein PVAR5_6305 [Paecilomyces variotii No. 5]